MKVLYVLSRDDKFGAPRALMEMVTTLKKDFNIEPVILTPTNNKINTLCNELKIENYSISYGTSMKRKGEFILDILRWLLYQYGNLISLKKISKVINFDNIDIIHSNNSVIDFGYKLAKKHHKKHIWHIREFADLDFNYYPFDKNYLSYMSDSYNIAISKIIQKHWMNKGLEKLNLIYDGIDADTIVQKTDYTNKKIKFLFMGSLSESKGQLDFIRSILTLDKEVLSNIELHLVGSGEDTYVNQIKELIEKNNLENIIFLDGYKNNIRDEIKEYDIGIVNSKSEAFGRVTVEYMASGLCVLASNTGANTELIQNEKTGLIFEYKNTLDICKKINYIYQNRNKIKEIGESARKDILNKYTKEINAKNVYELYKMIEGDNHDL